MLQVRHLAMSFGRVQALRDMSVALDRGEIRAVCGENGAGKSTLMKALTGVVRPDSGQILIDGKAVTVDSPQTAQQLGIALVAQELSLAPHLSILDNIWLGDRSVPLFHRRRELRFRAEAALRQLDVDYNLDLRFRSSRSASGRLWRSPAFWSAMRASSSSTSRRRRCRM